MKSRLFGFLLALLTAATLSAQTSASGDGRQAVQKPGIALVKPQKWSKPNEAVVVRFTAYTNRSAYFVLRTPSGQDRQVWVDQIVGGAPILEPEIPAKILEPSERNAIQKQIDNLKLLAAKVPSAAIDLQQISKPLVEAVRRYDSGEVRIDGLWEPTSKFRTREFYLADNQLQKTIASEADKSKFDLEQNSLFKQLVELSKSDATLQKRVEAIRADLQKQIAAQHQAQILDQLTNPNTPEDETRSLVAELKSIKNPNEKISLILEQDLTARTLIDVIAKSKRDMEVFFAGLKPDETPQKLPDELVLQNQILSEQIEKFRKSSPPVAIRITDQTARALNEICSGLPKISPLLEQRQFNEAAPVASNLADKAGDIGPSTQKFFGAMKTGIAKKIDEFKKLRTEGDAAEKLGNTKEAIAKYSAALEVMPNAELSAKIEQLKTPPKKQP